jgi:hypothetical protein
MSSLSVNKALALLVASSCLIVMTGCGNTNERESGAETQSRQRCTQYQRPTSDGRCIDTGAALSDPLGNFIIETIGTAGFGFVTNGFRRLLGWTGQQTLSRAAVGIVGGTTVGRTIGAVTRNANDCAFLALAVVTNSNPQRIANITGLPLGRVSARVFKEMMEEMGLRIQGETTHRTWDAFFKSLKPGNHDYLVSIQFPKHILPPGVPSGHVVVVRGRGGLKAIDPSRGVNGPATFGTNIGGEDILYPIEYIQVWQVAK